jgi:hypothetical protein
MLRSMSPILAPRDRHAAMAWLHEWYSWTGFTGPDFLADRPSARAAVIRWLEARCRTMRAAGIAGAHHYSLPLHTELLRILKAERAALQAIPTIVAKSDTESLPVPPIRQRLRAAA